MQLLHGQYMALVLGCFKRQQRSGTVSSLLMNPTPGNIRKECLNVYIDRKGKGEKEETQTLTAVFGVRPEGKDFSILIKNFDADKFKPLQNLLNGDTKSSNAALVELLAWLINFRHRPYRLHMDVELSEEEAAILNKSDDHSNNNRRTIADSNSSNLEEAPVISAGKKDGGLSAPSKLVLTEKKPKRKRVTLVGSIILAALLLGGYVFWQEQRVQQMALLGSSHGCMYWVGDHYEVVACDEDGKDRLKFPLDIQKMNHFKRITRTDTISEKSIGKIYYLRIRGGIEYYTGSGNHPVEITRTLQPLSAYMFEKHLAKEDTLNNVP